VVFRRKTFVSFGMEDDKILKIVSQYKGNQVEILRGTQKNSKIFAE
jgi:hypothetical protein